jgi:tagatose-1,6-bisphosphate aldolase
MISAKITITSVDDEIKTSLLSSLESSNAQYDEDFDSKVVCEEIQSYKDVKAVAADSSKVLHIYRIDEPSKVAAVNEKAIYNAMGELFSADNEKYAGWVGDEEISMIHYLQRNEFWEDLFPYLLQNSVE